MGQWNGATLEETQRGRFYNVGFYLYNRPSQCHCPPLIAPIPHPPVPFTPANSPPWPAHALSSPLLFPPVCSFLSQRRISWQLHPGEGHKLPVYVQEPAGLLPWTGWTGTEWFTLCPLHGPSGIRHIQAAWTVYSLKYLIIKYFF